MSIFNFQLSGYAFAGRPIKVLQIQKREAEMEPEAGEALRDTEVSGPQI
jgi:hypothetical protein